MKHHGPVLCALALALLTCGARAATGNSIDDFARDQQLALRDQPARRPKFDPKKVINESSAFLKEREPEMTGEEYALYEKVVTLIGSNPEFALKLLEAMMNEKEPPSPAFHFILGNAYYAANQNDKAEANYRSALQRFPSFLRAWGNLGVIYYTTDRFAQASECFSKAMSLGDRDPMTLGLLGYCLEKQGNAVAAEMAYLQAVAEAPTNSDWKEGLLRIYAEGRQFGRAESLVKALIKEQPAQSRFWLAYANILVATQRKLEAMAILEAALGLGVAGVDEFSLLGDLYAEQQLIPEASAAYAKLLETARPSGEKKLLHFAKVLIAGGKLEQADGLLAKFTGNVGRDTQIEILQARADVCIARQQWAPAREHVQQLLSLAPMNGRALLTLGRTYSGEEDLARATLAFESATRVPASTYEASLELANIEIKNRHYARSVVHLQKALSIERTDAVEQCLARVRLLVTKEEPKE